MYSNCCVLFLCMDISIYLHILLLITWVVTAFVLLLCWHEYSCACLFVNICTCFCLVYCRSGITMSFIEDAYVQLEQIVLNCFPDIIPVSCPPEMYECCSFSALHSQYRVLSFFLSHFGVCIVIALCGFNFHFLHN